MQNSQEPKWGIIAQMHGPIMARAFTDTSFYSSLFQVDI